MHPASLLSISSLLLAIAVSGCAPRVDVAAEEGAIRDIAKRWVEAVAAKDTMAIGNVYAEDAVFLPANAPRVSGRPAIRSAWAGLFQSPNLSLRFAPDAIVVSTAGDIAYEVGTYHLGMDGPRGQRIEDVGKYVVTWKKVAAEWQATADIFNSDKPAM